jgi:hypothetical protein
VPAGAVSSNSMMLLPVSLPSSLWIKTQHQSPTAGRNRPGYLVNLETRRGRLARIVPGDPMPEIVRLVPERSELGA